MSKIAFVLLIIPLFIIGCGISKGKKIPAKIEIRYDEKSEINYGSTIPFKTILTYTSGKQKDISGKSDLGIKVTGAKHVSRSIKVPAYPLSFGSDSILIEASYSKGELIFTDAKTMHYNYKGDLKLGFNGGNGSSGSDGSNGGSSMVFRHGKDGDIGLEGGLGENGHDLVLHVYKSDTSDFFFIRVTDLVSSSMYYYRWKNIGFGIKIYVNGGDGGQGGDGGDGGDGKDGKITEKKEKRPGDGGNGANGASGGSGGDGGSVYIFLHSTAAEMQYKISVFNQGGNPGAGGKAGKAGEGGKPAEGQSQTENGVGGEYHGGPGNLGSSGPAVQISVEEFDIDF